MKKQILFLVWLLCLMPFSLIGQENQENSVKLKPAQMTGWKSQGLNGNVKTVVSGNGESISFNQLGNIISRKLEDGNECTYSYTNQSQYMVDGYGPYIITFTDNQRVETDSQDPEVPNQYTFDSQGRVILFQFLSWPAKATKAFEYKDSEKLPRKMIWHDYDEYGDYLYTDIYEYITVDKYGNWTKRKVTKTFQCTEYIEEGDDKVTTETKTVYETRIITYYPDTNTSSSAQPAPQQNKAPRFPGGESAMVKFFTDNANPRKPAIATAGYGEVIVEFTVTEEGTIEDAKWKGRVSVSMDQEALRLVNMMPKWNPGFVDGQPAKMKVQVGLRFFPNQAFRYIKAMLY